MKLIAVFLTSLLVFPLFDTQQKDVMEEIVAQLKTSNSKAISKYMTFPIEMSILSTERICSKAEDSEQALSTFFAKHRITDIKIVHRIDSKPNYKIVVLLLYTDKGKFRTTISMKNENQGFFITELNIEHTDTTSP